MTDDRTIYHIVDCNLEKFEAAIAKLSKRAERMGCEGFQPIVFGYETKTLSDGFEHRVYEVYFTADAPKINGWTFIARLDHANDTGNIVRLVPNTISTIDDKYRTCRPACDHCNKIRARRDTFVLRCDATGEFKQVGSSCLIDFFGHDPQKAARYAEILGYAAEAGHLSEEFSASGISDLRWIGVETFCAHVASAIHRHGWVSGKMAYDDVTKTATREIALHSYFHYLPVTQDDRALAQEALAWAAGLRERTTLSDYEHNILVIAEAEAMEIRSVGLAASIVGVYLRNKARDAERNARASIETESAYVGAVGDKLKNIDVTLVGKIRSEGAFGLTFIYKFLSKDGNVFTWFSSRDVIGADEGTKIVLNGTVKNHQEYRGTKTTVLTRCKIAS